MDHWSIGFIDSSLGLIGVARGAVLLCNSVSSRRGLAACVAGCVLLALLMQFATPPLFRNPYERLSNRKEANKSIIETKSGVIAVDDSGTAYG
jgi:hypothetical protein